MEQIQYRSYLEEQGYKPKPTPDITRSLDRQAARFENDEKAAAAINELSDKNKAISASIANKEIEQLATFSKTLTEGLVKIQEKKNEEEMMRGIGDAYLNGVDPQPLAEGEQALKEADNVIQSTAQAIEKEGGDTFAAQQVRRTSGWYRYGLAIGMVRKGAGAYPAFVEQAKQNTSVTITNAEGVEREVTLATAENPAEYQAVMAEIRNRFLTQYKDVNPAILDKYLFAEMQKFEDRQYSIWARDRAEEVKNENIDDVLNNFGNGAIDINQGYEDLVAAGVSPNKAKELLLQQAFNEFKGGHITQEQLDAILDTPYGPGGTWRTGNRRLLTDIEQRVRDENIEDSRRERNEMTIAAQEKVNKVMELLHTTDSGLSMDQVDELLLELQAEFPTVDKSVFKPLITYRDNYTQQARDLKEQQEAVDALYASGELSVAELRSGKYSPEIVAENLGRAQQSDQMRAQAGQQMAASKNQSRAVQDAILRGAGLGDIESVRDPSVSLALDAGQAELQRMATELKVANPDMSWAQAYQQASLALVAEIQSGVEDQSSRWYVDRVGDPGSNSMPAFTAEATGAVSDVNTANQLLIRARDIAVRLGTESLKPEGNLFTEDEVKALSNPNNPPTIKLQTVVNAINSREGGARLTVGEARQQLVEGYGFKMERPYERDVYEETARSPELQAVMSMKTPAQVARVAETAGAPTLVIRNGTQGAQDVLQVSLSLGVPPQIAPLAAAVFANETGWGKYTSGKNNLFNIKSTDGTGTVTMTREGDINQSGGTPEQAQWRDYGSRAESVKDFWVFLEENPRYAAVLTARTPMEALRALKEAGYATSPTYVQDVARTFTAMGIDPNVPYQSTQLTQSRWSDTRTMSPTAAVYISGNIGPTSTGPHLDVKRVDGKYFDYNDLDGYVMVDDPELGRVPLGRVPQTGDWASHTVRGSHGRDYGLYSGTKIFLVNGAKVVSSRPSAHGDVLTIELPNGVQYTFIHGRTN